MPKLEEKTEPEAESEPKLFTAADLKTLLNENSTLKKQIRGLKGLAGRNAAAEAQKEPQNEPDLSQRTEKDDQKPAPSHDFKSWQAVCTKCGEKNPEFKDETRCGTEGCGQHLGSVEDALKLDHCPNCGGKRVQAITPEAVKKVEAMFNHV